MSILPSFSSRRALRAPSGTLASVFVLALTTALTAAQPAGAATLALDAGVRVQDDLYRAVNGAWLKDTVIPPDKADYGTFTLLADRSDERVHGIAEELAAKVAAQKPAHAAAAGSVEEKIGSYYRSYMDEAAIDEAGTAPLAEALAQLDGVQDKAALALLLGRWQGVVSTPVAVAVDPDFKEPGIYRTDTSQDGLGLPNRDYYLKPDAQFSKARKAYLAYLETMFKLAGQPDAARAAAQVFALEKRLAAAQWTPVQNRDPQKTYNPMTLVQLIKRAPGLDWAAMFKGASLPTIEKLSIAQPSYHVAAARIVADTPLATWKLYLRARLFDATANVLPKPWREARFAFHGKALQGLEQDKPRWKRAIDELDTALGEAVGQVYVERFFPAANKARMQELVTNLLTSYGQSIDKLTWMSPPTKQAAQAKLAKYMTKIGYPDRWRDYSRLEVRDGDALGNALRAGRFEFERIAARADKPVDRTEWGMTPQTVNAYYNPSMNEIVFPAAILEPPFFDMTADDAANYGAIGAIIGHEISHGFDDEGRQFDGDGQLRDWWTPADSKAFAALGARLVAQYNGYAPLPGHHVNGQLTLGENIADLSGLQMAYKAYHLALGDKPAPVIDGFTGDQRFFIGWALAWRSKVRTEMALQWLTVDPHSPDEFRANGAAVNHDGFHAAFGTQPGDKMYKAPSDRIRIW